MTLSRTRYLLPLILFFVSCGSGGGGGATSEFIVEVFLENLDFPVKLEFADDGRLFFTELTTGSLKVADAEGTSTEEYFKLPVSSASGNGLTGLALAPSFPDDQAVYVYYTSVDDSGSGDGSNVLSRIDTLADGSRRETLLLGDIPNGSHNGGALGFGPDGKLYLGTGDADDPSLSQALDSLAGKVLRLNPDGSVPTDNPFPGSRVFALGFRNLFGLDFQSGTSRLYVAENGPDCDDEINLVFAGVNYGWRPAQECEDSDPGFEQPLMRFNPSEGVSGVLVYEGAEFPELNGFILYAEFLAGRLRAFRLSASGRQLSDEQVLVNGEFDTILGIASDSQGRIYFSTPSAIYRVSRG